MQTLAKYDPYAIEEIEFFVQKKSKYTTLKSIVVTLAILAVTIFVNMSVIEHLWIPRSELPLVSNSRKMSLETFTSTYFCVFPKTVNKTLPKTTMINYHGLTNETLRIFSVTDKFSKVPEIVKMGGGRESICYDIEGAIVTDFHNLRLEVQGAGEGDFDLIFKTYSVKELMGDKDEKANYIYIESKPENVDCAIYSMQVKKMSAIYKDRLLIDYEPEKILSFGTSNTYTLSPFVGMSVVQIFSEFYHPFDLTDQYILTRYNIADITGRILSWFSLLVMISAFVLTPILDFNYKIQLAQKLYHHHKLASIDISILTYLKFLLSNLKTKLFDQEVLDTAFEQLQKDLDLLNLIKSQTLMKKLIQENQTLNIPHSQIQNANTQLNTDFSQALLSKQIAVDFKDDNTDNESLKQDDSEVHKCPLITEPDERSRDNFLTRMVKSFDISEVEISLISNKGEGYKTSWNTIITVFFLAAVMWFIIFAGLFKLSPNYQVQTLSLLEDESLYPWRTINPEDVIFRANKTFFSNFDLEVVLINKKDEVIETLRLVNDSTCDNYVVSMNETIGNGWMCLSKPIILQNDGIDTKTKLGLRLVYMGFGFSVTSIQIKIKQYNLINHELVPQFTYINHIYSNDPENQNGIEFYWGLNRHTMTTETVFKGVSIQLNSQFIRLKKTIPSLWNVINNAWGIVVLAFTLFLSKITRYLNVKQRENIIRNEENQNRNDIVAIISTQYKLISTVFYEELSQVKYFYKTKINDWEIKQN